MLLLHEVFQRLVDFVDRGLRSLNTSLENKVPLGELVEDPTKVCLLLRTSLERRVDLIDVMLDVGLCQGKHPS